MICMYVFVCVCMCVCVWMGGCDEKESKRAMCGAHFVFGDAGRETRAQDGTDGLRVHVKRSAKRQSKGDAHF